MPKSNEQSIVWFTPFIEVCAIKMSNTLPKTIAVDLHEKKKPSLNEDGKKTLENYTEDEITNAIATPWWSA